MFIATTFPGIHADTVLADAQEIIVADRIAGMVFVPTGSTITSITWYATYTEGGTFLAAYDQDGAAVVQTVAAAKAYQLPTALAGAYSLKAVTDADGTIYVSLKG
jgi:hypothetical protein